MRKYLKYFSFFLLFTSCEAFEKEIYSISVCTTSSMEGANSCKDGILKTSNSEIFILPNQDNKTYTTYLGKFSSYVDAKNALIKVSYFVKQQKPFVKRIDSFSPYANNKISQTYDEVIKNNQIISLDQETFIYEKIEDFYKLEIIVNSQKNIMELKGQNSEGKLYTLKVYRVSTAKPTIKKPLGEGSITSISLNPEWHPTSKTLKAFKEKGINLPSVVPFGHEFNYMGAAKINLTHKVKGEEIYRIHGTLNEDTIGTYESGGCIRMKNKDVFELATLLNQYINSKDLNSIKVILL
jgi:L,D-transpeptidase YcfS